MYQLSLNDNFPFNCQKHAINCYIYICVTKRETEMEKKKEKERRRGEAKEKKKTQKTPRVETSI